MQHGPYILALILMIYACRSQPIHAPCPLIPVAQVWHLRCLRAVSDNRSLSFNLSRKQLILYDI
jgi:hypothetical protein